MRVAVTGRDGQVARALVDAGAASGITVVPVARPTLDLQRPDTILPALRAAAPDAVVSAAAFTAVDRAEDEPALTYRINGAGAGAVAEAAAVLGVPLLHLSTDYVFDGAAGGALREDEPTAPLSVYGASKLEGERLVTAAGGRHMILRTAWVYSPFGSNFVRTMLRLAADRDEVAVVDDQRGCPTAAADIAAAILTLVPRLLEPAAVPERFGLFHLTGQGEAVWADVAEAVFAASALRGGPQARVRRITTAEYPTRARRPACSLLDGGKLERVHGMRLPPWRDSLATCVARLT